MASNKKQQSSAPAADATETVENNISNIAEQLNAELNGTSETVSNEPQEAASVEATTTLDTTEVDQEPSTETSAPNVEQQGATDQPSSIVEAIQATAVEIKDEVKAVVINAVDTVKEITQSEFAAQIAELKTNGTSAQKNLIATLENYIVEMKPRKPQTADSGAQHQYTLWITLKNIINNASIEEFKSLWQIILGFFKEHATGVFHEAYVYRFSEFWRWSKTELDGLQRILSLIKLTADPKTRAVGLKQIDLDRALNAGLTDEGRQRLINFYR